MKVFTPRGSLPVSKPIRFLVFLAAIAFFVCVSITSSQTNIDGPANASAGPSLVPKIISYPASDRVVSLPSASHKRKTASSGWNGIYIGGYVGASLVRATANTTTIVAPGGYWLATTIPVIAAAG